MGKFQSYLFWVFDLGDALDRSIPFFCPFLYYFLTFRFRVQKSISTSTSSPRKLSIKVCLKSLATSKSILLIINRLENPIVFSPLDPVILNGRSISFLIGYFICSTIFIGKTKLGNYSFSAFVLSLNERPFLWKKFSSYL